MEVKFQNIRRLAFPSGVIMMLGLSACSSSPADIVSAKCAGVSQSMAANSGKDAGAAQFMNSMVTEICKQAVEQCKQEPDGEDCKKARAVLEAAP